MQVLREGHAGGGKSKNKAQRQERQEPTVAGSWSEGCKARSEAGRRENVGKQAVWGREW